MSKRILFVCTGNTCRSSMAEYLFRHLVEESNRQEEFSIRSAGVAAFEDDPAAEQAIQVMGTRGIQGIANHKATMIHEELINEADLILTMTQNHKDRLLTLYPNIQEKVFTLKEYTILPDEATVDGFSLDIHDPYGQSVEVYQQCADEMEIYLMRILDKL